MVRSKGCDCSEVYLPVAWKTPCEARGIRKGGVGRFTFTALSSVKYLLDSIKVMSDDLRCIIIQPCLTSEQEIVAGNLTYNAGKVWNAANYELINGKVAFNVFDLYNKLRSNFFVRNVQSRSAQILMRSVYGLIRAST